MDVILAQKIENPVLCDKYLMGTELEVDAISDGVDVVAKSTIGTPVTLEI